MNSGTRNPLMEKIAAFIFGIVFIVFGIIMIQDNNKAFNEYKKSPDKQKVVAEVKSVQIRTERRRSGRRHSYTEEVTKYDCSLEYTLNNGNLMRNSKTYSTEKKVGDKITLNVYKDPYGNYKIAKVTSEAEKKSGDFWGYGLILVGVIAIGIGVVTKLD